MNERVRPSRCAVAAGLLLVGSLMLPSGRARAVSDLDEFNVKREPVFEFAQKPVVARQGDRVTIEFETKGFCDVTVAIEEKGARLPVGPEGASHERAPFSGRIIRHLASGVLGPNAPEPFAKNAKKQRLLWDSKDDRGEYIEDPAQAVIRVSLGLKPQFERTLFWDPHKRLGPFAPLAAAAPEGVYVFDGWVVDSLRLFDHSGNYGKTVYPFPADHLGTFSDLHWHVFPQDGLRFPLREGEHQATFLTSGDNTGFRAFGIGPKHQTGSGASALAVGNGRLVLAKWRLNTVASDGSSGGLPLGGPKTSVTVKSRALPWRGGGRPVEAVPTSAALSPDGKTLYLAGYTWTDNMGTGGWAVRWLHGVTRVQLEGAASMEVFAGSIEDRRHGKGPRDFHVPSSVACDRQGRVYVTDHLNDRLQVFRPDGQLAKSVPMARPARVAIHQRTGEIYVFSWRLNNYDTAVREERVVHATLTRLKSFDDPRPVATYPLPLRGYDERLEHAYPGGGREFTVALDSWTDPPTIWLVPAGPRFRGYSRANFVLLREADSPSNPPPPDPLRSPGERETRVGRLTPIREFGPDVARAIVRDVPPSNLRQRLVVNPRTGLLYLAEGDAGVTKSVGRLLEIDPRTGRCRIVELPFDAEDITFDLEGRAYLRSLHEIVRYDAAPWREIPFDYGMQRSAVGFASSRAEGQGMRRSPAASAIVLPVRRYNHHGGMMVAANGNLAVSIHGGQEPAAERREGAPAFEAAPAYSFRLFPGRCPDGLCLVYHPHGQVLYEDAIPGIAFTHGIGIDRQNDLYVMAMACRVLDGTRYHNEATDTLLKVTPRQCKVLSTSNRAPIRLPADGRPKTPPHLSARSGGRLNTAWVEGAHWFYGGVGFHARHGEAEGYGCDCFNSRFVLDYLARSFAPEVERSRVAVLDSNGNLILRIGRYGNVDDGRPLIPAGGPPATRSIGGDEVALCYAPYVATDTDRRLFIADPGNARILSVKLAYHTTVSIALKDVAETE